MREEQGGRGGIGEAALAVGALGPAGVGEGGGGERVRGRRVGEQRDLRGGGEQWRLAGGLGADLAHLSWWRLALGFAPSSLAHVDGPSFADVDLWAQPAAEGGRQGRQ